MKNPAVINSFLVGPRFRAVGALIFIVAALSGCAQISDTSRHLTTKPYDAETARAEAARIDPTPLRSYFPDAVVPPRLQQKGSYLRTSAAFAQGFSFDDRLSIAAAPMCWGELSPQLADGSVAHSHYSMALDKGKRKWLYADVVWIPPYEQQPDGVRIGDVRLDESTLKNLPDDGALRAHQARMASLDEEKFEGVLRDGKYLVVEKRKRTLRFCTFSVGIWEDELLRSGLVHHRGSVTSRSKSTVVYERVLDVFPRDEDLQWFLTHEYAAGIRLVMFGGSDNRDVRETFSASVDKAIARMAEGEGLQANKLRGSVFHDPAATYYLALYIGHNAGLEFENYLTQLRISDGERRFFTVDPKGVEYRERLLRHWWTELRAQHAPGTLVKPDPMASAKGLSAL